MTLNSYSKECSSFKQNTDPRYNKIINHVRNMNSIVIHDISISGEGISGMYSVFTELTFLRLCIENDLYHPHLYRWSVGVSVGTVIITFILNTRYLYECHSKQIALEYLEAVEKFIDFDNIRNIFFNIGKGKTLGDFAPGLLLKNLIYDGALCSRKALVELLQGNHINFKFNNKKQYFINRKYYNWLESDKNLDNVFFVCYAQGQTKMVVFTGNANRFKKGTNFIDYQVMQYDNLINAVLCSSAIMVLYPQPTINRDKAIDGASAEINQFVHLQILINVSFFYDYNILFTPLFLFFEITPVKNNNFLIMVNKRNIQYRYEDLVTFKEYSVPLLNSIATLFTRNARLNFNAKINVPLTALFHGQPYVQEFSTNDITSNILAAFQTKNTIITENLHLIKNIRRKHKYVPVLELTEEQFNSEGDIFCVKNQLKTYREYKKVYEKYAVISSNLITSTLLYGYSPNAKTTLLNKDYKEQLDENGKPIPITINICNFDQFVRTSYQGEQNFELNMLIKKDTGFLNDLTNVGFISGSTTFDIHVRQSLYTVNKTNVTCDCLKPFISEIQGVVDYAIKNFLGSNQS